MTKYRKTILKCKENDHVRIVRTRDNVYIVSCAPDSAQGVVARIYHGSGDTSWDGWDDRRPVNAVYAKAWRTSSGGGCWTEIIVRPLDADWQPITAAEAREQRAINDPLSTFPALRGGEYNIINATGEDLIIGGTLYPSVCSLRVKRDVRKVGEITPLNIVGLPLSIKLDVVADAITGADPLPPEVFGSVYIVQKEYAQYYGRGDLFYAESEDGETVVRLCMPLRGGD